MLTTPINSRNTILSLKKLSISDARTLAVCSQGFYNKDNTLESILTKLGCIQIDSISAVRRSHELVLLSRGLPLNESTTFLTANSPVKTFEYPAHAMAALPIEKWPYFGFRRRKIQTIGWRGPKVDHAAVITTRKKLRELGELSTSTLGPVDGHGWERTSKNKVALEWLLWTGEAVCTYRNRWKRRYHDVDLALPKEIRDQNVNDLDCIHFLLEDALTHLGVATASDIADYYRLPVKDVSEYLLKFNFEKCLVEGWDEPCWIAQGADDAIYNLSDHAIPLSPFDSLVWFRPRLKRLFNCDFVLEAYKKPDKREFGYFGMPILQGKNIVGRVAPRKVKDKIIVEAIESSENTAHEELHHSILKTLSNWTNTKFNTLTGDELINEEG